MALAGPGSTIWMDNMSIDQNNQTDVAAQVAVMGEIYGRAECVSVLLPESDKEAYETLAELLSMATMLLSRKGQFDYNPTDGDWDASGPEGIEETGAMAGRFFQLVDGFQYNLAKYKYWTRAWTFQEWARAYDVEVALDLNLDTTAGNDVDRLPVLRKVKSTIVYAAIMIADYKLRKGQYALMDLGWPRGYAKPKLDRVKRLFPFENAFAAPDEISTDEVRFQTAMPNQGTSALLGLRTIPRQPRTDEEQFKARLCLMLDSFAGMNEREATFEADLVCCWASMCNIAYDYSKDDGLPAAVAKAVRALRQRGIKIYNFTSNGQEGQQDVDLAFFKYAAAHAQNNATNGALFPNAPIFSGQADSVEHFLTTLQFCHRRQRETTMPRAESGDVFVQAVLGAVILAAVPLFHLRGVLVALSMATSGGGGDGLMFTDPWSDIPAELLSLPDHAALETTMLLLAAVPERHPDENGGIQQPRYVHLWALCPRSVLDSEGRNTLFVGRESLNGTLVVAKGLATHASIVAYLAISDARSGTFLVPVSEQGRVDVLLRTPMRSDIVNSEYMADRKLSATLRLVYLELIFAAENAAAAGPEGRRRGPSAAALEAYAASTAERGNEALVQTIGDHRTVIGSLLGGLANRRGLATSRHFYERESPGLGGSALEIDIGHPELVSGEQDVESRRRMADAILRRQLSLPDLRVDVSSGSSESSPDSEDDDVS